MVTLYEITKRLIDQNELDCEKNIMEDTHHRHIKEFNGLLRFLGIPQDIFKERSSLKEEFKFAEDSIEKIIYLMKYQKDIKESIKIAVKKKDLEEFRKQISPVMDFLEAQFKESPTNLEQCKRCIQYKFRIYEEEIIAKIKNKLKDSMSTSEIYPFDQPVLYGWYIDQLLDLSKNLEAMHREVEETRRHELHYLIESLNDSRGNYKIFITKKDLDLFIKSYEKDMKFDLKTDYTINLIYKLSKMNSQKTEDELRELASRIFKEYSKRKSIPLREREEVEKNYGKYNSILGLTIFVESVIDSINRWKKNDFKGNNKYFELFYENEGEDKIVSLPRNIEYFEYINSTELINDLADSIKWITADNIEQDAIDKKLKS
ncbi:MULTISPECIES: hypothetical protein [unclassified Exiguobacterium]|uniref:hypothetical protein n=1 Tax=unclassified Exiguobacterium TaxID=2644629 RepID=UPI001BE5FBF0|nr:MULTISPECIES: hypothetical protein [unclassified Exiguobacterium]